jgi:hypothetical protein
VTELRYASTIAYKHRQGTGCKLHLEIALSVYGVCFVNIATIGAYYAVSCSTSIMILLVHGKRARHRGRTGIVDRS